MTLPRMCSGLHTACGFSAQPGFTCNAKCGGAGNGLISGVLSVLHSQRQFQLGVRGFPSSPHMGTTLACLVST